MIVNENMLNETERNREKRLFIGYGRIVIIIIIIIIVNRSLISPGNCDCHRSGRSARKLSWLWRR